MITTPRILEASRVEAAVIPITCRREDMPKLFGPAVMELFRVLDAQSIESIGAVFAHHLHMSPDEFVFELGVEVPAPVEPSGRVRPGSLPAGRVAHVTYTGPYEGLHEAWGQFEAKLRVQRLEWRPDLWEHYVFGPDKTANPADFRTELYRPLRG